MIILLSGIISISIGAKGCAWSYDSDEIITGSSYQDQAFSELHAYRGDLILPEKVDQLKSAISVMLESNLDEMMETLVVIECNRGIKSEILTCYNQIHSGTLVPIKFRLPYSGLTPFIDVYDPQGQLVIDHEIMLEIGTTCIYQYLIRIWSEGEFTIIITEPARTGAMDSMMISVIDTE